jgi:hypothetical protein
MVIPDFGPSEIMDTMDQAWKCFPFNRLYPRHNRPSEVVFRLNVLFDVDDLGARKESGLYLSGRKPSSIREGQA